MSPSSATTTTEMPVGRPNNSNGVTDRPVIADPELTDVNQAYLSFAFGKSEVRAGSQELVIDNVRFVGKRRMAPEPPKLRRRVVPLRPPTFIP